MSLSLTYSAERKSPNPNANRYSSIINKGAVIDLNPKSAPVITANIITIVKLNKRFMRALIVPEIRDAETAQLAIQAALTGHLVFSTIHTNNSIGVVTRLLDMGIDPYLIAPTLNLAIAQRLVRTIAPNCSSELSDPGVKTIISESFKDLEDKFKKDLPLDKNPHTAVPSSTNPSGLKGRIPVFEMVEIDNEIENLILNRKPEDDIWKAARKKGMINMREDAMIKSLKGIVPFTEVEGL